MAITYVSESHVGDTSISSLVVAAPASIQNGDILVAFAAVYKYLAVPEDINLPSGFTEIDVNDTTYTHQTVGWKRASSESGDYTFSCTSGSEGVAGIVVLRGCLASGSPVDVYSDTAYTTNNTTVRAASVTTTIANTMLVAVGYALRNTSFSPPAGMSEAFDHSDAANLTASAAYVTQTASGASGDKDFTIGTSGGTKHAFLVAFEPDSAGNPWYAYAQQ